MRAVCRAIDASQPRYNMSAGIATILPSLIHPHGWVRPVAQPAHVWRCYSIGPCTAHVLSSLRLACYCNRFPKMRTHSKIVLIGEVSGDNEL
jgi:hypothetical protein